MPPLVDGVGRLWAFVNSHDNEDMSRQVRDVLVQKVRELAQKAGRKFPD